MKYVILLTGVVFCFLLGYLLAPKLRDSTPVAEAGGAQSVEEAVEVPTPEPQAAPEPAAESIDEVELDSEADGQVNPPDLAALDDNEVRQIMHDSIQRAEIDHFTLGQITRWKEFGEEQVDGVVYQFGLVDYRENTIFGEREFEAKALIRDGKVEKWIWTSNGMRIP
jgi:hypothetical protein